MKSFASLLLLVVLLSGCYPDFEDERQPVGDLSGPTTDSERIFQQQLLKQGLCGHVDFSAPVQRESSYGWYTLYVWMKEPLPTEEALQELKLNWVNALYSEVASNWQISVTEQFNIVVLGPRAVADDPLSGALISEEAYTKVFLELENGFRVEKHGKGFRRVAVR